MHHNVDITIRIPPAWHGILKRRGLWELDAIRNALLDAIRVEQGFLLLLRPLSETSRELNSIAMQLEFAHKRLDLDLSPSSFDEDLNDYLYYSRKLVENGLQNAPRWMRLQLEAVASLLELDVNSVVKAREDANRVVAEIFAARPNSFYKLEPYWATALLAVYCHIVDQPFSPLLQKVLTRAHESGLLPKPKESARKKSPSVLISHGPKRKLQIDEEAYAEMHRILSHTGWSENRLVLETLSSRLANQPPAHRLSYDCLYQGVLAVDNLYHAAMASETISRYTLLRPVSNSHVAFLRQIVGAASCVVEQATQQFQFLAGVGYRYDAAFRQTLAPLKKHSEEDKALFTAPIRSYLQMMHITRRKG